jgi:transaldolase
VPATIPGLSAITELTAQGVSVNVTLIFSTERYDQVIDAYLDGLDKALENGVDITKIHSVASFFVSRVDTEVDARLEAIGKPELKSKAALANARLAYELFRVRFSSARWKDLEAKGARLQRPLMASTGVKDPALPDTLYVTELVAANLVNTMPEKTMMAVADHGVITGDTISPNFDSAVKFMEELEAVGIDFDDVTQKLEDEGVSKFNISWDELVEVVAQALEAN